MSDFFFKLTFLIILFFKKLGAGIGGRREEPKALPLYYQPPKGRVWRRGIQSSPITFKSLRAVGIDNPRLEEGGARRMREPRTWGEDGGKCPGRWSGHFSEAQGPHRHPHEYPLPQKALQRPAPAQGHWGGKSWHLPPVSPVPP